MRLLCYLCYSLLTYNYVSGLQCFICDSAIHGNSCFDPINLDLIKPVDCGYVYGLQRVQDVPDFRRNETVDPGGSEMQQKYSRSTDFECVEHERMFPNTKKQFTRRCEIRSRAPNYCAVLRNMGNVQGFTLTKCNVCYTDRCNSSKNVKFTLFLNLIFFLIFYRCTDF